MAHMSRADLSLSLPRFTPDGQPGSRLCVYLNDMINSDKRAYKEVCRVVKSKDSQRLNEYRHKRYIQTLC